MAALLRKLVSLGNAAFRHARRWVAEMRRRATLTRRVRGFRLVVAFLPQPSQPAVECCGCGDLATTRARPARALRTVLGPVPDVHLALCDRCGGLIRARKIRELVIAATGAVLGLSGAAVAFAARPWAPWPWISLCGVVAASLALALRLLRAPTAIGETGWHGTPARWIQRLDGHAILETPSARLRSAIEAASPLRQLGVEALVRERDGGALLLVAIVLAALVAPALWRQLHPQVRIINLGARPFQVLVDARPVGWLPPCWTEAPNAGLIVRVPVGWRAFDARDDRGELVDRTRGWVASDSPALYAPAREAFCVWIEQRAYGSTPQPRPAVIRLAAEQSLYTLPVPVDAWFQPNPAAATTDRWFSGGIRRALRHGPCPSVPGP